MGRLFSAMNKRQRIKRKRAMHKRWKRATRANNERHVRQWRPYHTDENQRREPASDE
jgi:hypothetical protein